MAKWMQSENFSSMKLIFLDILRRKSFYGLSYPVQVGCYYSCDKESQISKASKTAGVKIMP